MTTVDATAGESGRSSALAEEAAAAPVVGPMAGDPSILGLGSFIVGSVACALAPTMAALIAARSLQGFGGGAILPIAQTIIADLVSPRERPRYRSYPRR